jgi:UDP-sugar pyrophosphorylase
MIFIQDTNALALKVLPSILGVSVSRNWEMNSVCVPRRPGEAMGAICKLTS